MSSDPNQSTSRRPGTSNRGYTLIADVAHVVTQALQECMASMFGSCDDIFFDLATRAKSSKDQNLYFESLREIRARKDAVIADTLARVDAGFSAIATRMPMPLRSRAGEIEAPRPHPTCN